MEMVMNHECILLGLSTEDVDMVSAHGFVLAWNSCVIRLLRNWELPRASSSTEGRRVLSMQPGASSLHLHKSEQHCCHCPGTLTQHP